ncbi:MAG: protein transport protein S31 [Cirrosporium novae-zelandiae]|nr:MAG: protein transport protein S31 [Cirrosporium novae-zelandiae]
MVRLREIPRTAAFAWSPASTLPLIATGTVAGAVDADFSNETQLEIWDLDLDNAQLGMELQPAASIDTDSRFHDIAWSSHPGDSSRGIIAGALENGSLDLWSADKLFDKESDALLSRSSKHSGAIKALQFNPFKPELLATAGAKGEVYISDVNDLESAQRLGHPTGRADDFECLDWNKRVQKILATGSQGGFVTVWDSKDKKENMILNNLGRKPVSAVAWDPSMPTRLVTAIPLDSDPLICVWDLRNSNAPERVLKGHESGVLSLSWCAEDPTLLLSSGKDNRTICWNPMTGEQYGEFPVVTNWTFQTKWNPRNPNFLATASFDGKIGIQTIQSTGGPTSGQPGTPGRAQADEDFFSQSATQPQGDSFSLPKAPKWLERPIGASFGFGAKIVTVKTADPSSAAPGAKRMSTIHITHFEVDNVIGEAASDFDKAVQGGDLASICQSRIALAQTDEDKEDWKVIETLISKNPRERLVEYLGFSDTPDASDESADRVETNGSSSLLAAPKVKGHVKNRLSSFFDSTHDDSFPADYKLPKTAKRNDPFSIYNGSESEVDKQITKALMMGKFEKALDICLKEDRMTDAFMFAICGGQKCIEKAQNAYFSKTEGPNYHRLLASVVGKDLWDVVYNTDLANWKEVMATLCTFADAKEFPDLCETLGDRLFETTDGRKDASFCYIAGSKLEKVVAIWTKELQEREASSTSDPDVGSTSTFSIHARALQALIEKVTVFREVTKFQDNGKQENADWKLAGLYDKYIEYADILATHGMFSAAGKYLTLIPEHYAAGDVAKNRVQQALRKPVQKAQPAPISKPGHTRQGSMARSSRVSNSYNPMHQTARTASPAPTNPYAPSALNQTSQSAQSSNPYAPQNNRGYQPPQSMRQPGMPAPPQMGYPQGRGVAPPPPRSFNSSPAVPPPSQAKIGNWNDIPDDFVKPSTSRRGTPAQGRDTVSSPFPNAPNITSPGTQPPPQMFGSRHQTPPVAPPPKGPPRMVSPPTGLAAQIERPSSAANHYAPPATSSPQLSVATSHMIPRGPSPYNAPPAAAPPPSRYAPAPKSQAVPTPPPPGPMHAPPPMGGASRQPVAPNPYTMQHAPPAASPYTPSSPPRQARTSSMSGSMHGAHPSGGSQGGSRPGTAQSQRRAPAGPKYPAGDRSHISPSAMPIYEILNSEMQRVKSIAPASYKAQVNDTEKRLNILFDHLNREDLLKPDTVDQMAELAGALQQRDHEAAMGIHLDILTNKTEECGHWMVGVKRLIGMSRAGN